MSTAYKDPMPGAFAASHTCFAVRYDTPGKPGVITHARIAARRCTDHGMDEAQLEMMAGHIHRRSNRSLEHHAGISFTPEQARELALALAPELAPEARRYVDTQPMFWVRITAGDGYGRLDGWEGPVHVAQMHERQLKSGLWKPLGLIRDRQEQQQSAPLPTPARWHELKTDPGVFDAVARGVKTHEIRFNDRGYQVGDGLILRRTKFSAAVMSEFGKPLSYSPVPPLHRIVTHVLEGYGLQPGWVALSLEPAAAPAEQEAA